MKLVDLIGQLEDMRVTHGDLDVFFTKGVHMAKATDGVNVVALVFVHTPPPCFSRIKVADLKKRDDDLRCHICGRLHTFGPCEPLEDEGFDQDAWGMDS